MVAHCVRVAGVAGSNPVIPIFLSKKKHKKTGFEIIKSCFLVLEIEFMGTSSALGHARTLINLDTFKY